MKRDRPPPATVPMPHLGKPRLCGLAVQPEQAARVNPFVARTAAKKQD